MIFGSQNVEAERCLTSTNVVGRRFIRKWTPVDIRGHPSVHQWGQSALRLVSIESSDSKTSLPKNSLIDAGGIELSHAWNQVCFGVARDVLQSLCSKCTANEEVTAAWVMCRCRAE